MVAEWVTRVDWLARWNQGLGLESEKPVVVHAHQDHSLAITQVSNRKHDANCCSRKFSVAYSVESRKLLREILLSLYRLSLS